MIDKIYLIQMDALIKNQTPCQGAQLLMNTLAENGMDYLVITEQTGRTRQQMKDLFRSLGFNYIKEGDFYTSAMAAVDYLLAKYPQWKKAAYIGGRGIQEALSKGGFEIDNKKPDLFFAGMDRNLSHKDYSDVLQMLLNGAILISTDSRRTQIIDGVQMIGNGSVVKMLEYACGKESVSFGRGSNMILRMALRYLRAKPEDVLAVGESFGRDIAPAVRMGMETALITNGKGIENLQMSETMHPGYIVENLDGLVR